MTSTSNTQDSKRFNIRWEAKNSGGGPEEEKEIPSELSTSWKALAETLLAAKPDFEPMHHYTALIERKIGEYVEGSLPPDENLMTLANQIEDIISALEMQAASVDDSATQP